MFQIIFDSIQLNFFSFDKIIITHCLYLVSQIRASIGVQSVTHGLSLQASSDLSILDFDIPYSMSFVITGGVEVVTIVLVMSIVTWQVLVVAIPIAITMAYVQVSLFAQELTPAQPKEIIK